MEPLPACGCWRWQRRWTSMTDILSKEWPIRPSREILKTLKWYSPQNYQTSSCSIKQQKLRRVKYNEWYKFNLWVKIRESKQVKLGRQSNVTLPCSVFPDWIKRWWLKPTWVAKFLTSKLLFERDPNLFLAFPRAISVLSMEDSARPSHWVPTPTCF